MTESVDQTLVNDLDDQRLTLLRRRLAERGLLSQQNGADTGEAAMTDAQRRMWFVHSVDPTGALMNICVSYRLTGAVDAVRLRAAVQAVAAGHPILRTTYRTDDEGAPQSVVHADLAPAWSEHDLTEFGEQAGRLRLEVIAQREFSAQFDLEADSPLRIALVRTASDEHTLLLVAHHIAWDDASWDVFFADLTSAYQDGPTREAAPPQAVPVAEAADNEADLAYWREVLADVPEPLELPGPNGSAVPATWRAQRCAVRLNGPTVERIAAMAREIGGTPYTVLLAAFSALLHRYTHSDDFLVAAPVLNRGADAEGAIGYFGNTIALRMRPRPQQSFRDLTFHARDTAMGAFSHQRISMDRVVADINPDRRHGVDRMARVGFGFRGPDGPGFNPPGIRCERAGLRGPLAQLPLSLMVEMDAHDPAAGAEVEAEFLTEVLDPALVMQMLDSFAVLVSDVVADPDKPLSRVTILGPDEAAWVRDVTTGQTFDTTPATLGDLVAEQAARTPDHVAVVYEGRRYTYRDIDAAANRVAHWLAYKGVGREDRVAVLLDKSPELVITALGILRAGAVYTPVDPTYPADRISYILSDCDAALVLRKPISGLDEYPADRPSVQVRPSNTAYLIYTSGSTGLPKGVAVPHAPAAEYFRWFGDEYRVGSDDRLLQVASPSFDVSIGEIFGTLICGARLVIPRPDGLRDIGYLTDLLQREGITSMHFVPSLLGLFLSLPGVGQWRTLRRVPIGGEALPGELADKFHATFDALLHNFYGPTETVVNATRYPVEGRQGSRTVPIGRPKINTTVHVLDSCLQPVPVGVIGEIYIGGTHLAHGYHDRPALTAERFVADPFRPGGRLYRTGDLARLNRDGDIEFVGRADEQVKIRGFRIELGEVAAAISVDPSVGQAIVLAKELPSVGKSLVAYVTAAAGQVVDTDRITARVAAALPDYMMPAAYVVVDEIPITANGKVDRAALPEPHIVATADYREPTTETERVIAGFFERLLEHSPVGADDSFFALGGHSLVATRLTAAIRSRFDVEVNVREIFETGTVAGLADIVDRRVRGEDVTPRPLLTAVSEDGPAPLSASQLRSWFAYRIEGPNPVNNIPFAAELTGECDIEALRAAVHDVVGRHEILRTTYCEIDGVPYQVVNDADGIEVRHAVGDGPDWVAQRLEEERHHGFVLETELPLRAAILSTSTPSGGRHVLSLVVHHIAADHWSAGVLLTDLLTAYRARVEGHSPGWVPLPLQYRDYAAWQAELLAPDGDVVTSQTDYWKSRLATLPEDTGLQPDFDRPAALDGAAHAVDFEIDPATRSKLTQLSRELGVTEFMLLQAAVAVVLHKAGAGRDIPIGAPIAGRSESALDQLVGFFINIVVMRNDLAGNPTLREVLSRARDTALGAYAHQDLPFDRVVDALRPARSLARNPLFSVVVHVREHWGSMRAVDTGDATFTLLQPTFDMAHADLSFNFFATDDAYAGSIIYRTQLYRPETVARLADWLGRVLNTFAHAPDSPLTEVSILGAAERTQVLDDWGRGQVYVLDEGLQPVPAGVVGDLYYGGEHAVRSHCRGAGLTASRLVANPLAGPGERMYRSGDRARWTTDGLLELIERPVESVVTHPTTPQRTSGASHPPQTDTERELADLIAELLGVTDVGRVDDFFMMGGDSILSVQLAARARAAGLALNPRMVFEHPTLERLAAAIDAGEGESTRDIRREPMSVSGLSAEQLSSLQASWAVSGTP